MAPKGCRKRPAADIAAADGELHRALVQCGTRTGLIDAIEALHTAGWLTSAVPRDKLRSVTRRNLRHASVTHSQVMTPYGRVIQSMPMPFKNLPVWEFIHPMAIMYHLTKSSTAFADVMFSSCTVGVPLRIVLYIDEVCPGNPLRPEKSRTLQAIYWACADWPQWVLQRTASWPTFGTIRSSLVENFDGGVAGFMVRILKVFFSENDHSFLRGVTITNGTRHMIVTGRFAGFLADEKALNQLGDCKGASGVLMLWLHTSNRDSCS